MSALLPAPVAIATDEQDQFVVSHGKSGVIGVFTLAEPAEIRRGQCVLVKTNRGIEVGEVLSSASVLKARLFGATSSGILVRQLTEDDQRRRNELGKIEQRIFEAACAVPDVAVLDVDLLFDGSQAIVQFVGKNENAERIAEALERQFHLTIRLENLATPIEQEDSHRCDKPDCGRESGGCTSCSTGGGCSTCGSSKVDMRDYFAHLRTKMANRIPLA